MSNVGSLVATIGYFLATIAMLSRLFHPKGPNIILVLGLGCIALIAHALANTHVLGLNDTLNLSLPNVISLVSLLITLSITALALKYKVNLLLPVSYGFAGIWQLVMLNMPTLSESSLASANLSVFCHIIFALTAYCVLVIATMYAFQVAYINMKLKNKNLLAVSHFPPLMQVESQFFTILALGTLCLLISQLIGFAFLEHFISKENAHKTVLSLLALGIYCTGLWGHYKKGWRGHRVLSLTVTATTLLTLAYFGSRFVKEFLL